MLMYMHQIQELILQLSYEKNVANMRLSELAKLTGVKHLQQIKHHRDMLAKKGLLSSLGSSSRQTIKEKILGQVASLVSIPILGSANAGIASLYAEGKIEDYLRISSEKLPIPVKKTLYALKAIGDSMNKAQIGPLKLNVEAGDYVVADGSDSWQPKSGDYVISLISGLANIKKLKIDNKNKEVILLSESDKDHPPIILDINDQIDYLAQSKVLHVVKIGR